MNADLLSYDLFMKNKDPQQTLTFLSSETSVKDCASCFVI